METHDQTQEMKCNDSINCLLEDSPMVGMVVTISPSLSLYKMVVLPAASRPTIRIRISFLAKSRLKSFANESPIFLFQLLILKLLCKQRRSRFCSIPHFSHENYTKDNINRHQNQPKIRAKESS